MNHLITLIGNLIRPTAKFAIPAQQIKHGQMQLKNDLHKSDFKSKTSWDLNQKKKNQSNFSKDELTRSATPRLLQEIMPRQQWQKATRSENLAVYSLPFSFFFFLSFFLYFKFEVFVFALFFLVFLLWILNLYNNEIEMEPVRWLNGLMKGRKYPWDLEEGIWNQG